MVVVGTRPSPFFFFSGGWFIPICCWVGAARFWGGFIGVCVVWVGVGVCMYVRLWPGGAVRCGVRVCGLLSSSIEFFFP